MKRKQLFLIGLIVVIALFLVLQAILFLNPTPGDGKITARVRFKNIEKIVPGTRVTFSGQPVGIVSKVELRKEDIEQRTSAAQYPYELVLKLDSSVRLFPQDIVTIRTAGLMGERSIAIIPMPSKTAQEKTAISGEALLYGNEVGSIEDTVETASRVLNRIDQTMEKISTTIDKSQDTIVSATNQLDIFLTALNNEKFVAKMTTFAEAGTECVRTYETLAETALHGKGTISYLLNSDTAGKNIEDMASKTVKLLEAIREYGLFFHSNSTYKKALAQEKLNLQNPPKGL